MPTGPRPMTPAEWEAYTLHLQREPVEAIEKQTGLSRPQIAAAVDHGRLLAQETLQTQDATRTTAPPRPVRVRKAVRRQLPGATIPPTATLPSIPDLPSATDRPPRHSTPAPAKDTSATPAAAARPAPDLDRLARSPKVRAWAAADGWVVPAEGVRLPGGIVHAYLKAHGGTT